MMAMNTDYYPINILLVEDNPADVMLTEELLSESKVLVKMHLVNDGVEALAFLRKEEHFANANTPDLVLLDLNLPRVSGHDVLKQIKQDEDLKQIPIIVLTTSQAESDIREVYKEQAAAYITKPVDLNQFTKVVDAIEDFWLSIVRLPPKR
jgi:two-component system response regulator